MTRAVSKTPRLRACPSYQPRDNPAHGLPHLSDTLSTNSHPMNVCSSFNYYQTLFIILWMEFYLSPFELWVEVGSVIALISLVSGFIIFEGQIDSRKYLCPTWRVHSFFNEISKFDSFGFSLEFIFQLLHYFFNFFSFKTPLKIVIKNRDPIL